MTHYKYYLMKGQLYVTSVLFERSNGTFQRTSYGLSPSREHVMYISNKAIAESIRKAISTPKDTITLHRV